MTHTEPGYITDKQALVNRLKRVEGQVRGLQRMVDEESYCIDILTQVSAATKALENVALPLELADKPDAHARAKAELEAVGLGHRLHHYPAQLSGGEQQRVAIARAVAPDPAILVADEPTGNLDEATGRQIVDLLFALKRDRGATLVLVTHDPGLARLCASVRGGTDLPR